MSGKLYTAVLISFLVFGGSVSSFATEEVGTIVLKSGEIFENVHYKVNKNYYVITIIVGDSEKKVLFSDVLSVHTEEGVDISENILGIKANPIRETAIGAAPKTVETWQSADSEDHKKAREKKWNIALSFKASYDAPTGEFYEGISGSVGFGGDVRIAISNQLALIGTVSSAGLGLDNSQPFFSVDPSVTILSQDLSLNATRILVGFEYYQPLNKRNDRGGMWYFHSLVGAIKHNSSSDLSVRDNISGQVINLGSSDSFTRFTQSFGGGVVPMLSPNIGLDLSGDIDLVWVSDSNGNSTSAAVKGYIFNFHAGLMLFL